MESPLTSSSRGAPLSSTEHSALMFFTDTAEPPLLRLRLERPLRAAEGRGEEAEAEAEAGEAGEAAAEARPAACSTASGTVSAATSSSPACCPSNKVRSAVLLPEPVPVPVPAAAASEEEALAALLEGE